MAVVRFERGIPLVTRHTDIDMCFLLARFHLYCRACVRADTIRGRSGMAESRRRDEPDVPAAEDAGLEFVLMVLPRRGWCATAWHEAFFM